MTGPQLACDMIQECEACNLWSDHVFQDSWKGLLSYSLHLFSKVQRTDERQRVLMRDSVSPYFSHLNWWGGGVAE